MRPFVWFQFSLASLCVFAQPAMSLYGNYQTVGITIEISASDDPNGNATSDVRVRNLAGAFADAFMLTRVSTTRFVGSLFGLQAGQTYEVEVVFNDADLDPIDGVSLIDQVSTRAEFEMPNFSRSLQVSPAGSGSECSAANPCSFQEALTQVQAGEEILLTDGVYFTGDHALPRSGIPGQRIAIRAAPGAAPILDGAHDLVFSWTAAGSGTYTTILPVAGPHLVLANGQRLYPYQSLADLENQIWGLAGFYAAGTNLTVKLDGGAYPNLANMVVAQYNSAIFAGQSYWIIDGIGFRHYGGGSYAKAIYLDGGSNNVIQNCVFAINDAGIGLKRESHQNLIQDNEFYDTVFLWPWDAVKAGSQLESGGVVVYDPMSGRGNVIRRNQFHDFFDGFQSCPGSDNGSFTNEMDIHDNEVYRVGDDGLSADGVCSNVRIWNNSFHDVLVGISLAPILEGPVYAVRNLVYKTGAGDNNYTGYPFKFNVGSQPTSGMMYLFHNTSDAFYPGQHGFDIKSPGTWQGIVSRNNIWIGTDYGLRNSNLSQQLDMDFDLLWNAGLNHIVRWGATNYNTLADFQLGTGQNTNGLELDPGFSDRNNADYQLTGTSLAIDQGVLIPGINDHFSAGAPDLGAFEFAAMSYSAWRLGFGDIGYMNSYDLNGDDFVDIRDFIVQFGP